MTNNEISTTQPPLPPHEHATENSAGNAEEVVEINNLVFDTELAKRAIDKKIRTPIMIASEGEPEIVTDRETGEESIHVFFDEYSPKELRKSTQAELQEHSKQEPELVREVRDWQKNPANSVPQVEGPQAKKERVLVDPVIEAKIQAITDTLPTSDMRGFGPDKLRNEAVKSIAREFLDTYYPAGNPVRGESRNDKLKRIGAMNTWTSGLRQVLASHPRQNNGLERARTAVREKIEEELILRERDGEISAHRRSFDAAQKGSRFEVVGFDAIEQGIKKSDLDYNSLELSSIEEDVLEGFDIKFKDANGTEFYVDTKADKSFTDELSDHRAVELGYDGSGVFIKRVLTDDNQTKNVIVINMTKLGYGGVDTNTYSISNNGVDAVVKAVKLGVESLS